MSKDVRLDMKGLLQLKKALEKTNKRVRIGILGGDASEKHGDDKNLTNAQVGAFHELDGERKKLPRRSFLEVPITDNFNRYLARSAVMTPAFMKQVIQSGNMDPLYRVMSVVGLAIVAKAFSNGGFGKWKPSDMRRKKVHQTLVETGSLSRAIDTDEVG